MPVQPLPRSEISNVSLSIVVPVYKEEGNIRPFLDRTEAVTTKMGISYEIIFALDPSPDNTEAVITEEINRNPAIKLLLFSRRFGQPAATMAGILNCTGEKCVVIDVDLQDQPELIEKLYNKMAEGYEVVYAVRASREGETLIKCADRISAIPSSIVSAMSISRATLAISASSRAGSSRSCGGCQNPTGSCAAWSLMWGSSRPPYFTTGTPG